MSNPSLATEAGLAGGYPSVRFNQRERKLLATVKDYVDTLPAGSITLSELASGIAPSHVVKFAGKYTTLGGSATEAQTVTGVAATDIVVATLQDKGATPRTILTSKPTLNTITYIFSGDPSTDHVVSYVVLRAAS